MIAQLRGFFFALMLAAAIGLQIYAEAFKDAVLRATESEDE